MVVSVRHPGTMASGKDKAGGNPGAEPSVRGGEEACTVTPPAERAGRASGSPFRGPFAGFRGAAEASEDAARTPPSKRARVKELARAEPEQGHWHEGDLESNMRLLVGQVRVLNNAVSDIIANHNILEKDTVEVVADIRKSLDGVRQLAGGAAQRAGEAQGAISALQQGCMIFENNVAA